MIHLKHSNVGMHKYWHRIAFSFAGSLTVLLGVSCASGQQQALNEYNQYSDNDLYEGEDGNNANYNANQYENSDNNTYANTDANYNKDNYSNLNSDYGYTTGEDINNFNEYGEGDNLFGADINNSALVENDTNAEPTIFNEANTLPPAVNQTDLTTTPPVVEPAQGVTNENYKNELYDEYAEEEIEGDAKAQDTLVTSGEVVQGVSQGIISDILPLNSELWWVGYDYNRRLRLLKIQILTKGVPSFDFLQERNQNGQPELIVRFYGTGLRPKIRRDIDASEFSSPVAYVRMRQDFESNIVDVVLTLREEIRPLMFAKNGNVQLTFPLTDRYIGARVRSEVTTYNAESLETAQVLPEIVVGSDMPKSSQLTKAYVPDPAGEIFDDAPNTGSRNVVPIPVDDTSTAVDDTGLPVEDFENDPAKAAGAELIEEQNLDEGVVLPSMPLDEDDSEFAPEILDESEIDSGNDIELEFPDEAYIEQSFTWMGVAQDDFGLNSDLTGGPGVQNPADISGFDAPAAEDNEQLNFNNVQELQANEGGGVNLSGEGTGGTSSGVVQAETLTMDDLGSASGISDIVGSDSEIIEEGFTGKPVVLEFYEAPLGQVLKAFADQIGTNFIYPPGLGTGTQVSIKLKDVPWDAALNALLETYGLGMARVADNIVRIDRLGNMTRYIADRQEAKNIKMLSQPSKILVIRLSNSEASKIEQQINKFIPQSLRSNVNFSSDEQTNTIYIEAPPAILARVKSLVDRLDVPVPQVEIISRLIEVNRSTSNFLGVSWAGAFNYDANRGLGFGTLNIPNSFGSTYSVDPGVNSASTVGSSTFNIGSINNLIDLNLRLKMEEAKGRAEILQSSRVLVKDRQAASISAGSTAYIRPLGTVAAGQVANQQEGGGGGGDGAGVGTITPISIQLSLNVKPRVTNDGHVEMELNLSSQAPASSGLPGATLTVNARSLQTLLRKKSGETAVIGGIYDTKKVEQESGIPFFSSLPIVGALFRSKTTSSDQTEMMMLITPRIQTEVEDAVAAGETAPVTYQGGGNLSLNGNYDGNNYSGNNYGGNNYGGNNYGGNNYGGNDYNYANGNYNANGVNASANQYNANNYGDNYGGNNAAANNYGNNYDNYSGNNYGNNYQDGANNNNYNGNNLQNNVQQSNGEYQYNNNGNY